MMKMARTDRTGTDQKTDHDGTHHKAAGTKADIGMTIDDTIVEIAAAVEVTRQMPTAKQVEIAVMTETDHQIIIAIVITVDRDTKNIKVTRNAMITKKRDQIDPITENREAKIEVPVTSDLKKTKTNEEVQVTVTNTKTTVKMARTDHLLEATATVNNQPFVIAVRKLYLTIVHA